MHFEGQMPKMSSDCDAMASSSQGFSSKRPLSKSLRRTTSNRAVTVRERAISPPSRAHQAILKASREQNPELHNKPQGCSTSRPALSPQTNKPSASLPPPLPALKAKHLSRSLTCLSPDPDLEKNARSNPSTVPTHPDLPKLPVPASEIRLKSNVTSPEKDQRAPVSSQQCSPADGPATFVKSFFRSSTFSALRDQNTYQASERSSLSAVADATPVSKPFLRSSSFIHVPSQGQEPEQEQKVDPIVSGFSKWARSLRPKPAAEQVIEIPESSPYSLHTGPSDKRTSTARVPSIVDVENSFGVLTRGLLDSSRNAVKAVQDKARHLVSQKRYQGGAFHLDLVYITESIIAMGFPGVDSGSNILGFMEANSRDYIEELITFCDVQHPGKYKIFNLCSEKLYDPSLLHDKVACFPFQRNNCPSLQLVSAFCEAAYTWLKAGLENVVLVHCKGGMARTGLMISCLLLHLKFFPTAEESMHHYNLKRCVDSNSLSLPSQLRYVKYYEQVLRKYHGFIPTGRRCTLRCIQLINCPSWIRPSVTISNHDGVLFTSKKHPKSRTMLAEDVWLSALKSGVFLFELPDCGHAATVDGDFKIQFQDRNIDFSCWLNTNMIEGNVVLQVNDLDGNEGLKEAAGFQVELELQDVILSVLKVTTTKDSAALNSRSSLPPDITSGRTSSCTDTATDGETNIFSDSDEEEEGSPEVSTRPCTENQDVRGSDATATTSQTPFQTVLSNAVTEVSTGFINAMDKFGITHLRAYPRSASMPNSPRIVSLERHNHGSSRSADHEKDSWSTRSSRFQNSKATLQKRFTYDFEGCESADMNTDLPDISCREHTALSLDCDNRSISSRSEDPGSSFQSEDDASLMSSDPPSDFQALAAASSADASLFTFGEEDYDSDEM